MKTIEKSGRTNDETEPEPAPYDIWTSEDEDEINDRRRDPLRHGAIIGPADETND